MNVKDGKPARFRYGLDNPHPLSTMKTELIWEGKYDEYGNRRTLDIAGWAMPPQKIETIDEPRSEALAQGNLWDSTTALADDFRNMLVWGDNKLVMASLLKDYKGKIDLIYIDPPFDVGADFTMAVPIGDGKEFVEKDQSTLEGMTISELKAKGSIDVEDDISFQNHSEVMELFGAVRINKQISFYKHPHEPYVHIWFPVFYQDEKNDWENTWGQKEETAFERRKFKNDEYLNEQFDQPDRHTRILFAKVQPFGRVFYKFKGIYKFDPALSKKAKKAAYSRIATKAQLYLV